MREKDFSRTAGVASDFLEGGKCVARHKNARKFIKKFTFEYVHIFSVSM